MKRLTLFCFEDHEKAKEMMEASGGEYAPGLIWLFPLLYAIPSLGMYTLFLNKIRSVRENTISAYVTYLWVLCIIIFMSIFASALFVFMVPFLVPYIFYFFRFRTKLINGKFD